MAVSDSLLQDLALDPGVLREQDPTSRRWVVWAPTGSDDTFEYWERIATAVNAELRVEPSLGTVIAASVVPARRRKRPGFRQMVRTLFGQTKARSFRLPDGRGVEQCGERKSVLLLVTAADGPAADENAIHSRWPDASRAQRLGPQFHLIDDSGNKPALAPDLSNSTPQSTGKPREQAEGEVKAARRVGDKVREATALTDLGVISLNEGNLEKATNTLELALEIVRSLGDQVAEYDILGHLGMVALTLRQPVRAKQIFDACLARARQVGDPYAEKMTLERLGITFSGLGDSAQAIQSFERALELARAKGDRHQESSLLWFLAVQFAESGERDRAISKGEEAISLSRTLGKPQAAVFGSYLQKYRMGLAPDGATEKPSRGLAPDALLGGAIIASVMADPSQTGTLGATRPSPPSLLRQALSATKAMANYVGSGFKTTPPEIQRKRVATCAACEHHTGMRCRVCGCFTEVKSRMLHEACPIGKWPQ